MKRLIATILTTAFLVTIVATPHYKADTSAPEVGFTILGGQGHTGETFTQ